MARMIKCTSHLSINSASVGSMRWIGGQKPDRVLEITLHCGKVYNIRDNTRDRGNQIYSQIVQAINADPILPTGDDHGEDD